MYLRIPLTKIRLKIKDYIIVIEMESVDYKQAINNAIQKINKEQTFWQVMVNLNYFFVTIYLNFLFNFQIYRKTFKIITFSMIQDGSEYTISEPTNLVFYDSHFTIDGYSIIYEHIIRFEAFKGSQFVKMTMFGLIQKENDRIIIDFTSNSVITVLLKVNNPDYFCNVMRSNMFYHIKYNKLDVQVIDKFNKLP